MPKNFALPVLLFLSLVVVFGISCRTSSRSDMVRINPRLPEDQIRQEILLHTPIGSNASDVLTFIRNDLKYISRSPIYVAGRSRDINIELGEYGLNPLERTVTGVRWVFDNDNKLVAVKVEKQTDAL